MMLPLSTENTAFFSWFYIQVIPVQCGVLNGNSACPSTQPPSLCVCMCVCTVCLWRYVHVYASVRVCRRACVSDCVCACVWRRPEKGQLPLVHSDCSAPLTLLDITSFINYGQMQKYFEKRALSRSSYISQQSTCEISCGLILRLRRSDGWTDRQFEN